MAIGGNIFLIAVGAILVWGVDLRLGWLDIEVVGWILMIVGAVAAIAGVIRGRRRTDTVVRERVR